MQTELTKIVELVASCLPYVIRSLNLAGQEASKTLGKKLTEKLLEQMKVVWTRLRQKQNVEQMVQAITEQPNNRDLHKTLQREVAHVLSEDPSLREEITQIYAQVEGGDVEPSGEVTGVKASFSNKNIRTKVKVKKVAGRVIGVDINYNR